MICRMMTSLTAKRTFLSVRVNEALTRMGLHKTICRNVEFACSVAEATIGVAQHWDEAPAVANTALIIVGLTATFFFSNHLQLSYNTILLHLTVHHSLSAIAPRTSPNSQNLIIK